MRRLRRHRDRARATRSGATRRSRRPSRRSSRPASSRSSIGGDHACTLPHLRATRSRGPGRGHRLRLAHRRLGQLLRREVQPRDVDAAGDRGGAGRRRPLDRGRAARVALRRRATGRGCGRSSGLEYLTTEDVFRLGAGRGRRARSASGSATGRRSSASTSTSSTRPTRPEPARPRPAGRRRATCWRSCAALTRHRLRRVRRRRGHPGVRPGRPDGDAGGEPRLRDAVARRAAARRAGDAGDERRLAVAAAGRLPLARPGIARPPASRSTSTPRARSSSSTRRRPTGSTS